MRYSVAWVVCGCIAACGDQLSESSDPPASVVATVAEPPGVNCAGGGVAIESGLDRNDNGVLDASEVTTTSYVCAGVPGSSTLVGVVAEPPGVHCANGGEAIETGFDVNGNGVLDPSEVSQTTYVCGATNPAIIDGSFTVNNSVDAAQLVGVTTITGNLTIDAAGLTALDLSALQTVTGTVTYIGFSGTTLAMPALTSTAGILVNGTITTAPLELPVLATAGFIRFTQYDAAATATFPALTTIAEDLNITSCSLTTLSFPVLTAAQSIFVAGCPALTSVDFSHLTTTTAVAFMYDTNLASVSLHLTSAASLTFHYDLALTALDLSSLTTLSQRIEFSSLPVLASLDLTSLTFVGGSMYIAQDDALATLAFPALTSVASTVSGGAPIEIGYNATLSSISAPLCTTFGPTPATPDVQIIIDDNPQLATCEAQAFADHMGALTPIIYNNDDSATCP
jgi:hypothetical protein